MAADIIVSAIIAVLCVMCVVKLVKDRKSGCASCGYSGFCTGGHCDTKNVPERFKLKKH